MIERTLERMGLREDEAKSYLYLLENGSQTAGDMAKKTGLSRPSLYGFLSKLRAMGLIVESQKNGLKTFAASPKEKVEALLDERISELESGKSDISRLFAEIQKGVPSASPKFRLFEGRKGMDQILKDMLMYRNIETRAYWPIRSMVESLGRSFFESHNKERVARGISTRAIWPDGQKLDVSRHPYLGSGPKFLREIRIAPKEAGFSMGYWIYGDKVACISSVKESFGFIIESREFVEMLSSQFEMVWKLSKKT